MVGDSVSLRLLYEYKTSGIPCTKHAPALPTVLCDFFASLNPASLPAKSAVLRLSPYCAFSSLAFL